MSRASADSQETGSRQTNGRRNTRRQTIVLLHGLWMPAAEMAIVKYRLERAGQFRTYLFGYRSLSRTLDSCARSLAAFIRQLPEPVDGLVGHSLGGIVGLRALASYPNLDIPRVICLGSPLTGCRAAASLCRHTWGRTLIGRALSEGTLGDPVPGWIGGVAERTEIGVVAGNRATGIGRFFAGFDEPNDGTVAVSETRLPEARDHIVLPVSHTGMVASEPVATQVAAFLQTGHFVHVETAS